MHILNEFYQTEEKMNERYISKDSKNVEYSHPLIPQEGLHHAIFYEKPDHIILLNEWPGSILSPLLMFTHQNLLGIIPKEKHSEDSFLCKGN